MNKYSPSMIDGKIVRLSVSQLSQFDTREKGGCKRKWAFNKVHKIPWPTGPGQQDGIDGHKRFEDYYNGQPVVFLDSDIPALAELPKPGPDVKPEVELTHLTLLRTPFQGAMDLVEGTSDIYDYKFQSKIRVYSEPTAQLWGYLEELRLRNNAGGRLSFHHVYIQKTAPYRAKKVTQTFEPREVERNWATYGSLIKEMQDVAAEKNVDKVEANKSACYAYGPCPYLGICNRNPLEEDLSFLDDLEKAKTGMMADKAVVNLPEIKALPPDAPAPDAIPTAPSPPSNPAPTPKKRGRPSKAEVEARKSAVAEARHEASGNPDDVGGWSRPPPPILDTPTVPKLKSMRFGLSIGMPEFSSIQASAEVEGGTEEEMEAKLSEIITRRLEKLIPAYKAAIDLKRANGMTGK